MHASRERREKVKDKERKGENNRLSQEWSAWRDTVIGYQMRELKARWISGMTLQRDDITTVERGNRSRCVYRDVRALAVLRRNGDVDIDGHLYLGRDARDINAYHAADNFTRAEISAEEPRNSRGGSIREFHRASYRNCSLWETPLLRSQLSQCT